jgi:hypothetical protein
VEKYGGKKWRIIIIFGPGGMRGKEDDYIQGDL